jgi:hypothetical protein
MSRHVGLTLLLLCAAGCAETFSMRRATEITREQLLNLSEKDKSDHVVYVGTEGGYHYVCDVRPGTEDSYKVRADSLKLTDTFRVGSRYDEPYVLYPWVIEGKPLGRKPE